MRIFSFIIHFIQLITLITAYHSQQAVIDGILEESLRSNRVQACDGETVTLSCPRNTNIVVETGFYGRVVPESMLCPAPSARRNGFGDSTCDVIQAKTKLSELCDKKRKCTIEVDSKTFEHDPCPSTSKYLQMSYKCKPVSFNGETFCNGVRMELECRDSRRLAIYSASYGRKVSHPTPHCAAPTVSLRRDCTRDVLPSVLASCQARRSCSIPVADSLGQSPCPMSSEPYLHILYVCVNEEVFSDDAQRGELPSLERYQKELDNDEDLASEWERLSERPDAVLSGKEFNDQLADESKSDEDIYEQLHNDAGYETEDRVSMRLPDEEEPAPAAAVDVVGYSHDLVLMAQFFKENREKVILCVIFSVTLALLLLTTACIAHRCCGRGAHDQRVRYSIERSQLLAANSPYSALGGPASLTDIGDVDCETFLRYSLATPPRSAHYDF